MVHIFIYIAVTFKESCISHTEHINVFRVIFRINSEYFFIENWVIFHTNWIDILFEPDTEFSSTSEKKKLKISKNILFIPDNTEHRWNKAGSLHPVYLQINLSHRYIVHHIHQKEKSGIEPGPSR